MHSEGSGSESVESLRAEWRWEPVGDPDAPEAYHFSFVHAGTGEPTWEVTIPAGVVAKAVFAGRRPELMIDPEEGRLIVAGQGLDDNLLDALTCAFSGVRLLSLAAELLESDGISVLAHQGSKPGELKAEIARLKSAVSAAKHRFGND